MSRNEPLGWIATALAAALGVTIASGLRCDHQRDIEDKVDKLIQTQKSEPQLQTRDVIGNFAPEKFYEIDGQRVYLEIDGKPLEQYFPQPSRTN